MPVCCDLDAIKVGAVDPYSWFEIRLSPPIALTGAATSSTFSCLCAFGPLNFVTSSSDAPRDRKQVLIRYT